MTDLMQTHKKLPEFSKSMTTGVHTVHLILYKVIGNQFFFIADMINTSI